MKCPKCGYNSFEYLDSCKKCNADLISFKVAHGIRPTILPAKDLAMVGAIEEQGPDVAPPLVAAPMQDSEEFSWHESSEETATEPGTLPSLGLDLPPPEPDHFNFNLDLPSEETESASAGADSELPFEGFGNEEEDFLLKPEPAANPPSDTDEPSAQEEKPFGELSFEDIYSVQESELAPAVAEEAPLPDFFTPNDGESVSEPAADSAFDGLLELERNSEEEAPSFPQEAAEQESVSFLTDELPTEEAAGNDLDLLGLSPEEYESLFGESPLKKKDPGKETGEATLS